MKYVCNAKTLVKKEKLRIFLEKELMMILFSKRSLTLSEVVEEHSVLE